MSRTAPALLAFVVLAVWGPLLVAPLVSDDRAYLFLNPDLSGAWPGVWHWLTTSFGGEQVFEPVNAALHFGLWRLFGGRVWALRASSLALHWADAWLVLALLRRLLRNERAALALAVLFCVFPPHHDVLGTSTSKKHLLVAFFGLASMVFVLPRARRPWAGPVAATLLGLALLTKESALALPILGFLIAEPDERRAAGFWLWQAAACAAFLVWRLRFLPVPLGVPVGGGWARHLITSAKLLIWYWGKALVPWPLCTESGVHPVASAAPLEAGLVAAGVAAAAAACVWAWKRDRLAGAGLTWFCVGLAPFLNIAPTLNMSLTADRYLYLPLVGLLLAAGRLIEGRPAAARAAWAVAVLGWSALSLRQAAIHTSALELASCAAACAPDNARARVELGNELKARGRLPEAVSELERAVALAPAAYYPFAGAVLAQTYADQGRLSEAEALARRVAGEAPSGLSYGTLGQILLRRGDDNGADAALVRALALSPGDLDSEMALARLRSSQGRFAEAEWLWLSAARSRAYRAAALAEAGWLRLRAKRVDEAENAFRGSLAVEPYGLRARSGLAEVLAMRGRRPESLRLYDELIARLDAGRLGGEAANVRAAREDFVREWGP